MRETGAPNLSAMDEPNREWTHERHDVPRILGGGLVRSIPDLRGRAQSARLRVLRQHCSGRIAFSHANLRHKAAESSGR